MLCRWTRGALKISLVATAGGSLTLAERLNWNWGWERGQWTALINADQTSNEMCFNILLFGSSSMHYCIKFIYLLFYLFTSLFACLLTYLLTYLYTYLLTYLSIYLATYLLIYLPTYLPINLSTYLPPYPSISVWNQCHYHCSYGSRKWCQLSWLTRRPSWPPRRHRLDMEVS